MVSLYKNHIVIRGRTLVGQTRLMLRKGTKGPKLMVFVSSSKFRIGMNEDLAANTTGGAVIAAFQVWVPGIILPKHPCADPDWAEPFEGNWRAFG